MSAGRRKEGAELPEKQETSFREQDLSGNQQGIPRPILVGTKPVALGWMTPIYFQYSVAVPETDTGRK